MKLSRSVSLLIALCLPLAFSACGELEEDNQPEQNVGGSDVGLGDGDSEDAGFDADSDLSDAHAEPDADPIDPEIVDLFISSQELSLTTVIAADLAVVTDDAILVIHQGDCSAPGDILGHTALEEGVYTDLEVALTEPLIRGESHSLCGALYGDDNFDDFDAELAESFEATVGEGTPDVQIQLASAGSRSYTLLEVIPEHFEDVVDIDPASTQDDIRFTFREGWRYEIFNTVTNAHPFQFLNEQSQPELAQNMTAPLEDDPTVDWEHDASFMVFTISDSFQSTINSYRCAPHIAMFGAVTYSQD